MADCLNCGVNNDDASSAEFDDAVPVEGNVSICFSCTAIAVFTGHGLEIRAATPEEFAEIMQDAGVRAMLARLQFMKWPDGHL